MKVGVTLGTWDLLHPGHVDFLRRCRTHCDWLTVAVNPDAFVARFKRTPIMSLPERIEALDGCRWVDQVIVNTGCEDSRPAILTSSASVLLHGDDWTGDSLLAQLGIDQAWLDQAGVELVYLPYTSPERAPLSTSELIRRARVGFTRCGYPVEA